MHPVFLLLHCSTQTYRVQVRHLVVQQTARYLPVDPQGAEVAKLAGAPAQVQLSGSCSVATSFGEAAEKLSSCTKALAVSLMEHATWSHLRQSFLE